MTSMQILLHRETAHREELFTELYQLAFPAVAHFVSARKGSFQDAKDVFQDSLIIFYEKMQEGKLVIEVSKKAYIIGIAKHLWIKKFNHDRHNVTLNGFEERLAIPEDLIPEIHLNKLLKFLELTGEKCLAVLRAFYYDKHPMSKITKEFGFRSEHSATVQKFKCLEKIRNKVKEKSITYEDFTE
jgi:DNA-directed RNA polymerase specialized sigma24 family protein